MKIKNLIFSVLLLGLVSAGVFAQSGTPFRSDSNEMPTDDRGSIIARVLELTDAQRVEIQAVNQKQRQLLRLAQLRLQTARAAADMAIYADVLNEADVEAKVQEVAMAQAEIIKIRMMSEIAVRSVLSPEQLVKFRALRERFAEQRRKAGDRRRMDQRRQEQQRRRDVPQRPGGNNPPPRQQP